MKLFKKVKYRIGFASGETVDTSSSFLIFTLKVASALIDCIGGETMTFVVEIEKGGKYYRVIGGGGKYDKSEF